MEERMISRTEELLDIIDFGCSCIKGLWTYRVQGGDPFGGAGGTSVWACDRCLILKRTAVEAGYEDVLVIPVDPDGQ